MGSRNFSNNTVLHEQLELLPSNMEAGYTPADINMADMTAEDITNQAYDDCAHIRHDVEQACAAFNDTKACAIELSIENGYHEGFKIVGFWREPLPTKDREAALNTDALVTNILQLAYAKLYLMLGDDEIIDPDTITRIGHILRAMCAEVADDYDLGRLHYVNNNNLQVHVAAVIMQSDKIDHQLQMLSRETPLPLRFTGRETAEQTREIIRAAIENVINYQTMTYGIYKYESQELDIAHAAAIKIAKEHGLSGV